MFAAWACAGRGCGAQPRSEVPLRTIPKLPAMLLFAAFPALAAAADGDPGVYVDVVSDLSAVQAISGLGAIRGESNGNGHDDEIAMWGVGDRAVAPSRIYGMTVDEDEAVEIVSDLLLTLGGQSVSYDLEGIDVDTAGGWWRAVEGGATRRPLRPPTGCSTSTPRAPSPRPSSCRRA